MNARIVPVGFQRLTSKLGADLVEIKTKFVKLNDAVESLVLIRADQSLLCFKFDRSTNMWSKLWRKGDFFTTTGESRNNPWMISEDGFVVARTGTGLHIYKFDGSLELVYLATDGRYNDIYGWSQRSRVLLMGHFFDDSGKIGIMSRNGDGVVTFEAVVKEEALQRSQQPVWRLDNDPQISPLWSNLDSDITLAYVDSTLQQAFVIRSSDELNVFKFGKSHFVQKVLTVAGVKHTGGDDDQVFFGKFSLDERPINSLLHFNETGLTVYGYAADQGLQPIMYASQFAGRMGWTPSHVRSVVLQDVDGDGLDEMLFSGPAGFQVIKMSTEEVLADVIVSEQEIDVCDRHVKVFAISKVLQGEQRIVSISEHGVASFQLMEKSYLPEAQSEAMESDRVKESKENPIPLIPESDSFRSVLPVHDQLDVTTFLHPRNPLLGFLDFSVPLIEVSNPFGITISQSIQYKEYAPSGVLGAGWSLPVDCIYVDRHGSVFPVDHSYYLVKDGVQSQLFPEFDGSQSGVGSFSLNGSPEVEIKFMRQQNLWEIKTKHEQYSYGRMQNVDWIQWEQGSEEWPVAHSVTSPVKFKPFAWLLAKREDHHGNHLKYVYIPEYEMPGISYAQKLHLRSITSSNGDYVRFHYATANNTKLLKAYAVKTHNLSQNVHFKYSFDAGKPRLKLISQSAVPVLQFGYDGPKNEMTEIIYPNGLISKFSYSSFKLETALKPNTFEFFSDVQVSYGPSYMLIGGKTETGQVRIKACDVVGSATTEMSNLIFPALGKEPVISFKIHATAQFFAVVLNHDQHQQICVFRETTHGWSSDASYINVTKDSTLQTGNVFILIRSGSNLAVLQHTEKRLIVKPVMSQLDDEDIVQVFPYAYVVYNDSGLTIGFRSIEGEWIAKLVSIGSNLIRSSLHVFDQFDTDQKIIGNLKKLFKNSLLTTYHNAIIVKSLSIEGRKIYLRLHCKILNSAYELVNDETVSVLVEDLDQFLLELPEIDENHFKIGYKSINGKFKVTVKGHTGKIIDHMVEKYGTDQENQEYRNALEEIYKNVTASIPFALDPGKFDIFVNSDNIIAASHKFRFDGNRWTYAKIPDFEIGMVEFRMKLGDSLLLHKSAKNETIRLSESPSDRLLWDSNTMYGSDLILNYPVFIGVQRNRSAEIFTFANKKAFRLPKGEFLSRMSNPLAIVSFTEDLKSVTIRPVKSFIVSRQSVITKQELCHSERNCRLTTFEYDPEKLVPFSDGFAFSKSKAIPGGKPQLYGWYENNFNLMDMNNSSKTVHSSDGVIVQTIEAQVNDQPEPFDPDQVLTDRMGRFAIVDFRPFRISEEVVSYYGFEPYEANRIGANRSWIFDSSMVTRENFNNFLRLEPGSSLSGHFEPHSPEIKYVFSCWVRSNETLFNPASVGLVPKSQIGEWQYVENIFESTLIDGVNVIDVVISNPAATHLDVDHLRLTPLDFNFQANLLDHRTAKVKAVLRNSGWLEQKLLNLNGHQIGRISDTAMVDLFVMSSQSSAVWKNGQLVSLVELRPAFGEIVFTDDTGYLDSSLKYSPESFSFRFLYKLTGSGKIVASLGRISVAISRDSSHTMLEVNNSKSKVIDSEGELTALFLPSKIAVWIQGHLIEEKSVETSAQDLPKLEVKSTGQGRISEMLCMYDPSVKVIYLNKLGQTTQEIILKNQETINIRQILYDAIDRPVVKTKWVSLQPGANSYFNYNPGVITNSVAVLAGQTAEGLANYSNPDCQGYPFTWTTYRNDPLEVKVATGLPGKDFSVKGQFSTKFGTNHSLSTLKVLFPVEMGYKHQFEQDSGGSMMVEVFDKHENKVAELVKVMNHDHRLTTFEYHQKRLLRMLPPLYHHKAKTMSRTDPFESLMLTPDEIALRDKWGKCYKYDKYGRLIEKSTPDSGKHEFIYSDEGLLRFLVEGDVSTTHNTIYYTYGFDGKVVERGIVDLPRSNLPNYLSSNVTLPKSKNYVTFDYGGTEVLPLHRSLMQMSRKVSEDMTVTEALLFDSKQQLMNQIFVSPNNSLSFNYKYENDKLRQIEYPFLVRGKQLILSFDYHIDKNIKAVRIGNRTLATMDYTPMGSIQEMQFEPQDKYTYRRSFSYNQPGYLSAVKDKFLTEVVDYTSNSYGGQSFGDGTVSATMFNATWHEYSDIGRINLNWQTFSSNETSNQYAQLCFENLQKLNYFDRWNRPIKTFYPSNELQMPLVCNTGSRSDHIASVMVTKGFPTIYGHRYDYESHKQLIKAKYFQNLEERQLEPLSQLTFSKRIRGVDETKSQNIWNALKSAEFIITDCSNSKVCHALPGKSLFHPVIAKHINAASLEVMFIHGIKTRKDIPQQIFNAICEIWHQYDPINRKQLCTALWSEMMANNFVGSRSERSAKALSPELRAVLKNHSRHLGDIVGILFDHFVHALGNSAGDVQSYDIDPNGNHVHFYTGFKRYRLDYVENTNKISKIFATDLTTEDLSEVEYSMDHDSEGNVTKATHKSIGKIVYDPLLKRAIEIAMLDGRKLIFRYDVRGERIFKQVRDKTGRISKEKYYMRDVTGRCLVDYELTYLQSGRDPHARSTAYIYVADMLIGFIRNDQFYSVFTDHEGSVRLVVKNGEVVAAYDYLPYGQILRKYNSDPDGSIAYLYTGQEWDEETELFNFHARLYDPEIGRFYQIDPKEQYPSPYVYAGNSPISLVDPDGQFAFLVTVIATTSFSAYLGASEANHSFNPLKWKLTPTLIGIAMGVLEVIDIYTIPASLTFLTGIVGLPAAVGLMAATAIGFAFLSSASNNNGWDPLEWNWSSPGTWNSLFSGAISGASIAGSINNVAMLNIKGIAKILLISASAYANGAFEIGTAKFWNWDWTKPDAFWATIESATIGVFLFADMKKLYKTVFQNPGKVKFLPTAALIKIIEDLGPSLASTIKDIAVSPIGIRRLNTYEKIKYPNTVYKDEMAQHIILRIFNSDNGLPIQISENVTESSRTNSSITITTPSSVIRHKRNAECCQLALTNYFSLRDQSNTVKSGCAVNVPVFQNILNWIHAFFKPPPSSSFSGTDFTQVGSHQSATSFPYTISNCYHFNYPDQKPSVRCFGRDSNYNIFTKLKTEIPVREDYYSHCTPIEYAAQPSIVCHGRDTTMLITPSRPPVANGLDVLNGWLMLALVMPKAIQNIKSSVLNMFSNTLRKSTSFTVSNDARTLLNSKMDNLRTMVHELMNSAGDLSWFSWMWEDLDEDVRHFQKAPELYDVENLLDRATALEEELVETCAARGQDEFNNSSPVGLVRDPFSSVQSSLWALDGNAVKPEIEHLVQFRQLSEYQL